MVDLLREHGAGLGEFNPARHGPRLLAKAAAVGETQQARELLAIGADAKALTDLGTYPLSIAAETGRIEIARLLLDAGADPNRKDKHGRTPLHYAKRRRKNTAMMEFLRSRGATD